MHALPSFARLDGRDARPHTGMRGACPYGVCGGGTGSRSRKGRGVDGRGGGGGGGGGESVARRNTRLVVTERVLGRTAAWTSRRSQMKRPMRLRRTSSGLSL